MPNYKNYLQIAIYIYIYIYTILKLRCFFLFEKRQLKANMAQWKVLTLKKYYSSWIKTGSHQTVERDRDPSITLN